MEKHKSQRSTLKSNYWEKNFPSPQPESNPWPSFYLMTSFLLFVLGMPENYITYLLGTIVLP